MSEIVDAFMRKYDRVYNPEANAEALREKEEAKARKAALAAQHTGKSGDGGNR